MFIQLHEYYYDSRCCGYQTKLTAVNTDEISDFHETVDPYHNIDGVTLSLKNGRTYQVKESYKEIMKAVMK